MNYASSYLSFLLLSPCILMANPLGEKIISGKATFQTPSEHQLTIDVSDRAIIEWTSFSIQSKETTTFIQPSHLSAVLNRVSGKDPSSILGTLQSNGAVYLINPQGIVFGKEAVVDVGSIVASTLDISNTQFLEGGEILFEGESLASIHNLGKIQASSGNLILAAHTVKNDGTLAAPHGTVALGSSHEILLQTEANPLLYVKLPGGGLQNNGDIAALRVELQAVVDPYRMAIQTNGVVDALQLDHIGGEIYLKAENGNLLQEGELRAPGGTIAFELYDTFFSNTGKISAPDGKIVIESHSNFKEIESHKLFSNSGLLDVSGDKSGLIEISVSKLFNSGTIAADGIVQGGVISIKTLGPFIETFGSTVHANSKTKGGKISIESQTSYSSSGSYQASGLLGGAISIHAPHIGLAAAHLDVSGTRRGGSISITSTLERGLKINTACTLSACAASTTYHGNIALTTNTNSFSFSTLSAINTPAGECFCPSYEFLDPNPTGISSSFGEEIFALPNGNVIITKYLDNLNGANSGAAYLFNGATGAHLSSLVGGNAGDQVSYGGVQLLPNGNYVVSSPLWMNDLTLNAMAGAVTWRSASATGLTTVLSSNSIVGTAVNDQVSSNGIYVLNSGHCVILSSEWNGTRGAATWMNGANGTDGNGSYSPVSDGTTPPLSTANSIFGTVAGDYVGLLGSEPSMNSDNFAFGSTAWNGGRGAVAWMDGATGRDANGSFAPVSDGTTPPLSTVNSIFGTAVGDNVGFPRTLANGHFVISSPNWNGMRGAATWMNGMTGRDANGSLAPVSDGTTPPLSTANSIFGGIAGEIVTNGGAAILANGNYLIGTTFWNGIRGAITWMDGTTGRDLNGNFGVVTDGVTPAGMNNSIVGSSPFDNVGNSIIALTNGHAVACTPSWNGSRGAATWINGDTGLDANGMLGTVSTSNSITGSAVSDSVSVSNGIALTNGNAIILSTNWNGLRGAATWINGNTTGGLQGRDANGSFNVVSTTNSLFGTNMTDNVGNSGSALPNGNAVLTTGNWDNTRGAATWINGETGKDALGGFNAVSASNSLVGNVAGDSVGNFGIIVLATGDYIVVSSNWSDGVNMQIGALTPGDGTTGMYCGAFGPITSTNSIIGPNAMSAMQNNASDPYNETFLYGFGNVAGQTVVFASSYNCPAITPSVTTPFTITIPESSVHNYLVALSEAFSMWSYSSLGGYLEQDSFPPSDTPKNLLIHIPSLLDFETWNPPSLIYKTGSNK